MKLLPFDIRRAKQRGFLLNPFRFGGGGGGPTDPNFANVVLLVHADSTFADSSSANRSPTVNNATINTSIKQFGAGSGSFGPSNATAYVTYPNSSDFNFGSGDFTVECWFRRAGSNAGFTGGVCHDQIGGTRGWLMFKNDGSAPSQGFGFAIYSGATVYAVQEASAPSTGTFRHYAAVRDGNTLRLYRDGVQVASASVTGVSFNNCSEPLVLGTLWGIATPTVNSSCDGYLDDIRITKGVCRYPSGTTFTAPTAAFPDS